MDADHEKLKLLRSFNLRSDSFKLRCTTDSSINRENDPDIDCQGYTSLRDVIHSPPTKTSSIESNAFDASTISIRNELVKHAASVYVQSAIITSRHRSFFAHFLDTVRDQGETFRSCCGTHIRKPLQSCFGVIYRFFIYMASHIARVCRGRVAVR